VGLTVISFLTPVFPFLNVIKGKLNFEDAPIISVTTCYVNYFCWYVYGDMIFSDQLKYGYVIGSCIFGLLIVIYLIFEIRKYLVDTILNALILITGTWALYRALTIIIDDDRVVGKICIGTAIIVYVQPMQIIYKVIKEKNYGFIPIYNCYLSFLSSVCWLVYGIFITDFYVVFPYAIGIILSLVQIVIYLNYQKKYPIIGERDFSSTIGIETTPNEEVKKEATPIKMDEMTEETEGKEKPVKISAK
jgi:lipid-A-disaccharide synthase-like uncharacterized protein